MTDQEWNAFGYDSNQPCAVCGNGPTKSEPRFGYSVCRQHAGMDPTAVSVHQEQKKETRCLVGSLTNLHPHPTRPDLRIGYIHGHRVVVGDHYDEGNRGFHIPIGAVIPEKLLREMWLWNSDTGKGRLSGKKGNVVKAKEMDGVTSDGLFYGAYYFNREDKDYDAHSIEPITTASWNEQWVPGQDVAAEVGITFKE